MAQVPAADWSSLPGDVLMSIADLLTSFRVLTLFSSVCRSWRSAALATYNRPPLLLKRVPDQWSWRVHDPACPSASSFVSFYMPPSCHIVNVSRGHIIAIATNCVSGYLSITVVNPLSGQDFHCPPFPPSTTSSRAFLSFINALLLNDSNLLVLFNERGATGVVTTVLQWQMGSQEWGSEERIACTESIQRVWTLANGRLFAASHRAVYVLTLEPPASLVEVAPLPAQFHHSEWMESRYDLVACGEAVLYLRLVSGEQSELYSQAFRLEVSAPGGAAEWVRVDSLGDWCIFLTLRSGLRATACPSPGKWGGRSGGIYFPKIGPFHYSSDGGGEGCWHVADTVDGATGVFYDGPLGRRRPQASEIVVAPWLASAN